MDVQCQNSPDREAFRRQQRQAARPRVKIEGRTTRSTRMSSRSKQPHATIPQQRRQPSPPPTSRTHLSPPPLSHSNTNSSPLLSLPGELRNKIYRLSLLSPTSIEVGPKGYPRSGLLRTNREIRAECLEIFYYENSFDILALDLDPTTLERWCRMLGALGKGEGGEREEEKQRANRTIDHSSSDTIISPPATLSPQQQQQQQQQRAPPPPPHQPPISQRRISMNPHIRQTAHWPNLLRWLHKWHIGAIPARLTYPAHLQNAEVRIVHAMFDMAMCLRGQPWRTVEGVLSCQRSVLEALNAGWGVDWV